VASGATGGVGRTGGPSVNFRLLYEGPLPSSRNVMPKEKQTIRQCGGLPLVTRTFSVLALCALLSYGCARSTHGRDMSLASVGQIRPGVSRQQVEQLLGQPTHRTLLVPGREVWTYIFSEAEIKLGTTRSAGKAVSISFDGDQVIRCTYTEQTRVGRRTGSGTETTTPSPGVTRRCDEQEP
jgi:outer membrane protein assembly factor BamE (lipoprotein component of BamABCDE complex)